jgi:hypothetical protein
LHCAYAVCGFVGERSSRKVASPSSVHAARRRIHKPAYANSSRLLR